MNPNDSLSDAISRLDRRMEFEQAFILSIGGIAEVVDSTPTLSISFIILVNYGIVSSLILTNCPTKTLAMAWTDQAQRSVMIG
jgi:hypothetical protein